MRLLQNLTSLRHPVAPGGPLQPQLWYPRYSLPDLE